MSSEHKILTFGEAHSGAQYRKSVGAVIYNPKINKVLAIDWRIYPVYGIVQGGQENENEEEALKREIVEETGYTDFLIKDKLGENIFSYFYADTKKVWRKLELSCYLVELISENQIKQNLDETENFDLKWIDIDDFIKLAGSHIPTQSHNFQSIHEFLLRAKYKLTNP